ncbi:MAG TPA: ABC transporter permease [Rhizomicrobium sp.]|nr:ABC transporter permease [Rhizomicrobium sp.]
MFQDLRYALRSLRKSPGFTAATVLTLALGIGANTAIFSVVNAVLLKSLPYKAADRLVIVYTSKPGSPRDFVSQLDLDDWRAMTTSFSGLASSVPQSVNLTGRDEPERIVGDFVSANFFSVIDVQPALGRLFLPGEDRPGAERVAVLTDSLWHNHFGGDPSIVGRSLIFNGEPYTVAGVLPPGFVLTPWDVDVFLPAYKYPNYTLDRASAIGAVFGRLAPGVSLTQAQTEMNGVTERLASAYPASNKNHGALLVPLKEVTISEIRPTVIALAAAVAFVLLIGCANVAGLLMTRIVGKQAERAIRLALGASRGRLISHVLAEALVIAAAGGALGLIAAFWGIDALARAAVDYMPSGTRLALDGTVAAFTFGVSLATALLVAALPAWQGSGARPLQEARGSGSGAARNPARNLLVVAEVALALILLVGAGLTIKSLLELGRANRGFDAHNVLTMEYRLPRNKYASGAAQTRFHEQVVARIQAVPGVIAASSVRAVPLRGNGQNVDFLLGDRPEPAAGERPRGLFNAADPYFFSTMRIGLLRGRVFTEHDQAGSAKVAVINQTLALRYFTDRDPIGQVIRIPGQGVDLTAEIVGVVDDVKQFSPADPRSPQIYGVLAQNPFVFTSLAVRTAGDPMLLVNDIRQALWQVDKDQPVWGIRTMEWRLASLAAPRQFVATMLGGYAALALLLASIGIFGVVSYVVSQRTAEIGIRMALGARPSDIARLVLGHGLSMALIGIGIGVAGAAWLARYLRSELYAVSPFDPRVYAMVAALLALVATVACLIPARRAISIDPVEALRRE